MNPSLRTLLGVTNVTAPLGPWEQYEIEFQFHLASRHPVLDTKRYASPHRSVTSLDRVPRLEWVEVLDMPPGRRASRHLGQLGISVHEKLRVLSTAPLGGPVLVDAGGTTVAIGRSLASRITVRLMSSTHGGETP